MRRVFPLTLLTLMLTSSVALADRGRRANDHRDSRAAPAARHQAPAGRSEVRRVQRERAAVRSQRVERSQPRRHVERNQPRRVERSQPRRYVERSQPRRYVERRAVHVHDGRYVFHGGVYRVYRRPVITQRYFDYRYRPRLIIEAYDPVPGYVWVQGHWHWDGREWLWVPGHYVPDPAYYDDGYGPYYDDSVN
jgi:hypothetical protein